MFSPENVTFVTFDGLTLAGHLYSAGDRRPCIIMSHGVGSCLHPELCIFISHSNMFQFSGLKENFLPDYALRFTQAGYTVLTYDNRCWGESEGMPRNYVDPILQLRDYVDAFDFASTHPSVDSARIIFWGSSMSGGNAICAATIERRIRAVIVQVPFVSGEEAVKTFGPLHETLLQERAASRRGNISMMAPVMPDTPEEVLNGTSKAILRDVDAVAFNAEMDRRHYKHEKQAVLQSVLAMVLHEPRAVIHRIAPVPLLMVVAEKDRTIPTTQQLEAYSRALEPKQLHILKRVGHFDPYFGSAFEENIAVQLEFLKKHV